MRKLLIIISLSLIIVGCHKSDNNKWKAIHAGYLKGEDTLPSKDNNNGKKLTEKINISSHKDINLTIKNNTEHHLGYKFLYSKNKDMKDYQYAYLFMTSVTLPFTEYKQHLIKDYTKDYMKLTIEDLESGTYYYEIRYADNDASRKSTDYAFEKGSLTIAHNDSFKADKTYKISDTVTLLVDKNKHARLRGKGKVGAIDASKIKDIETVELENDGEKRKYAHLKSLTIEEGITSIIGFGFSTIEKLVMPDSLISWGRYANSVFGNIYLKRIIYGKNLKLLHMGSLCISKKIENLYIPKVEKVIPSRLPPNIKKFEFAGKFYDPSVTKYVMPITTNEKLEELIIDSPITSINDIPEEVEDDNNTKNYDYSRIKAIINRTSQTYETTNGKVTWKNNNMTYTKTILPGINKSETKKGKDLHITYHLNGGSIIGKQINSFKSGSKVTLPLAKKDGCLFVGWYQPNRQANHLKEPLRILEEETEDITLEAIWADIRVTSNKSLNVTVFNIPHSFFEYYQYIFHYSKNKNMKDAKTLSFSLETNILEEIKIHKSFTWKEKDRTSYYTKDKISAHVTNLSKGTYYYQVKINYDFMYEDDEHDQEEPITSYNILEGQFTIH